MPGLPQVVHVLPRHCAKQDQCGEPAFQVASGCLSRLSRPSSGIAQDSCASLHTPGAVGYADKPGCGQAEEICEALARTRMLHV